MKQLIICADGTRNTDNQTDHGTFCPTTVVKIARAPSPRDDPPGDGVWTGIRK